MITAKQTLIHPLWLRLTHWLNALAMLIMVTSGWRIYNASPLFNFSFINELTLGGWLGGALQWHFAGMWLFGINGLCYLLINLFSGRFKRQFWPLSPKKFVTDLWAALRGKLSHAESAPLQHGAACGLSGSHRGQRSDGAFWAGVVEVGAVSPVTYPAWGLRRGPLCALFCHDGAGWLRGDPSGDGGPGATYVAGHVAWTLRRHR